MAILPAKPVTRKPAAAVSRAPKAATPAASNRVTGRAEALTAYGDIIGAICILRGQFADAGAIAIHQDPLALAVARTAETNDKLAQFIDRLTATGPVAEIFMAGLPLAMQLMANHGKIDASQASGFGGIIDPKQLEQKMQLKIAAEQRKVQAEIEAMQAEVSAGGTAE